MNKVKQAVCLILVFVLLSAAIPLQPAKAENIRTLLIGTAEELCAFSEDCSLDSFSKGLSVKLTADISLAGKSFSPVPIFYGSFDGGGHAISGLIINSVGSKQGLFRRVETGAVIKNLRVSGSASPTGSAESVGLIAGVNSGLISSCTVTGTVVGDTDVGGVAGQNLSGGVISLCNSKTVVSGRLHTGGIVGINNGTVENCVNSDEINTSIIGVNSVSESSGITDITGAVDEVVTEAATAMGEEGRKTDEENEYREILLTDISDTGGIVGRNTGSIKYCSNSGTVGYNHVGYNTGGIAGLQNGIVSKCENSGAIFGRKDVGGIVGQFEPDISLYFGVNGAENLESQLSDLTSTLKSLTNSLSGAISSSVNSAKSINSAVGIIEGAIKKNTEEGGNSIDTTMDSLYTSLQKINASASVIIDSIASLTVSADTEMAIISQGLLTLASVLDISQYSDLIDEITAQNSVITEEIGNISAALGDLEGLARSVSEVLNDSSLSDLEKRDKIEKLLKEHSESSIDRAGIAESMSKIAGAVSIINADIGKIADRVDIGNDKAQAAIKLIFDASDRLQSAVAGFSNAVTPMLSVINREIDNIEDVIKRYADGAGDRLSGTFNTVYEQLSIINGSMKDILNSADSSNNQVGTLLNTAINEMELIGKSVAAMLGTPQYSSVDVSDTIEQEEKPGQISGCRNTGSITADANVGGVAGIMAIEIGSDPEEDFSMADGLWVDTTALFRAIIMTGSNSGSVTAKNEYAGGAVGRCDVGAVYKTENIGTITAVNGSYCGGIAGSSLSSIIKCSVLCDLEGNDYLGGLVGKGVNLSGSRAMVRLNSSGECVGAIAGSASGELSDNFFVKEGLAAIDGVSYEDKAYPLIYSEFIALEGISEIFTDLHTDFYVDGSLVKRIPTAYGSSLDNNDIPILPSRSDSFGVWEEFETENLFRSQTVNAVYRGWVETISSGGDLALALAEGQFSNQAVLTVSEVETVDGFGALYKSEVSYVYSITDESLSYDGEYLLHLYSPDTGNASVALTANGRTVIYNCKRDGSYLLFNAPADGEITILRNRQSTAVTAAFIAFGIILLLLLILLIRRKKKCPKREKPQKAGAHLKK